MFRTEKHAIQNVSSSTDKLVDFLISYLLHFGNFKRSFPVAIFDNLGMNFNVLLFEGQ